LREQRSNEQQREKQLSHKTMVTLWDNQNR